MAQMVPERERSFVSNVNLIRGETASSTCVKEAHTETNVNDGFSAAAIMDSLDLQLGVRIDNATPCHALIRGLLSFLNNLGDNGARIFTMLTVITDTSAALRMRGRSVEGHADV